MRIYYHLRFNKATSNYELRCGEALADYWPKYDGFTMREAVNCAAGLMRYFLDAGQLSELVVVKANGLFGERRTYGKDPKETKG